MYHEDYTKNYCQRLASFNFRFVSCGIRILRSTWGDYRLTQELFHV